MKPDWICVSKGKGLETDYYICNGCANLCQTVSKDKPTVCIQINPIYEVSD